MDIQNLVCGDDRRPSLVKVEPATQTFSGLSPSTSLESLSPFNSYTSLPPIFTSLPSSGPVTSSVSTPRPMVSSAPIRSNDSASSLPSYSMPSQLLLPSLQSPNVNCASTASPDGRSGTFLTSSPQSQLQSQQQELSTTAPSQGRDSSQSTRPSSSQRVECGLCGKSFSGISSHNRHVSRTHHKARPFSCLECGLQFGQKGSLDRHTAAVHLKARPFECHFCKKGFGRKDNLKIHMTTVHLKKKPFKCDMCPKSFGGKRPLKIHRQTVHFKERPLQCMYCEKRFGQRSNLNVHMKVHKRAGLPLPSPSALPTSPIGSLDDFSSMRLEPANSRPSLESQNSTHVEVFSLPFGENRPFGSPI